VYLTGFATSLFQANCYLVGPGDDTSGGPCVIIDPGMESAQPCHQALAQARRTPVAVLATHGHIDHVADAAALAGSYGVPLWIHGADRPFLTDPKAAVNAELDALIDLLGGPPPAEPAQVREYTINPTSGQGHLEVADLQFELRHAPGHTPGCTMLCLDLAAASPTVFTGDVVFAGSIGRTDFRVGNPAAMRLSLRDQVLPLPDAAALLPGHGPATTMARERATNPYLLDLWDV
jgi:glyoxylase-like metal-dependent hydrolase (beta-lactamase superfamily II)